MNILHVDNERFTVAFKNDHSAVVIGFEVEKRQYLLDLTPAGAGRLAALIHRLFTDVALELDSTVHEMPDGGRIEISKEPDGRHRTTIELPADDAEFIDLEDKEIDE